MQEVFIVSSDNETENNFFDIEKLVRKYLKAKDYVIPILPIPSEILRFILWLRYRSNIKTNKNFSSKKLYDLGFYPPNSFKESLREYIENE